MRRSLETAREHPGTGRNMKTCTKCSTSKDVSEFGKHSQTKDGLKSRCKLCHSAESRASRTVHVEKARAREAAYHHAHREERNAKSRVRGKIYRVENHKKCLEKERVYREENGSEIRVRLNKWKSENPGRVNADTAKRRAAKLRATPKWADTAIIKAIYEKAARLGKEVDHIIPLRSPTVCGLHWEGNLQLLSSIENARKGNSYVV